MLSDQFFSNNNINAIKYVIDDNIKSNYNISINNKYDDGILETMKYVLKNVSSKVPSGYSMEDYIILMNKKVYNIITPMIKEDINSSKPNFKYPNNKSEENNKDGLIVPPRNVQQFVKSDYKSSSSSSSTPDSNKIYPARSELKKHIPNNELNIIQQYEQPQFQQSNDLNQNRSNRKVDPLFDPVILQHYEKIPINDHPVSSSTDRIKNERDYDIQLQKFQNDRNSIHEKPIEPDFRLDDNINKDNSSVMKNYNELLSQYDSSNNISKPSNNNSSDKNIKHNVKFNIPSDNTNNNNDKSSSYTAIPLDEILNNFSDINGLDDLIQNNNNETKFNNDDNKYEEFTNQYQNISNDLKNKINRDITDSNSNMNPNEVYQYKNNENLEIKNIYKDIFQKASINQQNNELFNQSESFGPYPNNLQSVILQPQMEVIKKKYRIIINSYFRNKELYPDQNLFEVKFNPASDSYVVSQYEDQNSVLIYRGKTIVVGDSNDASIPISFDNIQQICVTDVHVPIFPYYVGGRGPIIHNGPVPVTGQDVTSFSAYIPLFSKSVGIPKSIYTEPYLYLIIPELEHSYYSTGNAGRKAFVKLEPDYSENPGILTVYGSQFAKLKPTDKDETYLYDPVLKGKVDKMTLSLYNMIGKQYNMGIDKLFVEKIERGPLRYDGYCGNNYYYTRITIQKTNKNYSDYCSQYYRFSNNCNTLNSHPVSPGDLLYFFDTTPQEDQVIYLEDYVKVYNIQQIISNTGDNALLIKANYNITKDGKQINNNVIFKNFIPGGNTDTFEIYNKYYIVLGIRVPGHVGLLYNFANILGFADDGVIVEFLDNFDYSQLNLIEKIGFAKNNLQGINTENKYSLFNNLGYNVYQIGNFTNQTQVASETIDQWVLDIDFPYDYLDEYLKNESPNYGFKPGEIFFIQHKLQISYNFEFICSIKNYKDLVSNINDSGLNFYFYYFLFSILILKILLFIYNIIFIL